jgi:hypothetical protein
LCGSHGALGTATMRWRYVETVVLRCICLKKCYCLQVAYHHLQPGTSCLDTAVATRLCMHYHFFAALCGLLLSLLHAPWSSAVQVSRCAAAAAICTLAIFVVAATTTLAATDKYCFVSSGCRLLLFTVQVGVGGCSRLRSWIQAHFTSGGCLALHFASMSHCLQVMLAM